jgi:cell division protein ZapA (FtsZ GTPase activity inhibitor)
MHENIKELYQKDHLTQKDIIQLLLHNAQHMVTRDELKEDNRELKNELKEDIANLDLKIEGVKKELKEDIAKLDQKIEGVRNELKDDINKVNSKFDRLQWFLVASVLAILFKEKLMVLLSTLFG